MFGMTARNKGYAGVILKRLLSNAKVILILKM